MEDQLKVLIVDDEVIITDFISYSLEETPYHIRVANSGPDALDMMSQAPADILITDINMPDMNGLQLTEKVLQIYPDTLAIAMTGYGDIDIAVEFMKRGGADFLQKPMNKAILHCSIESVAERCRLRRKLRQADEALIQKNLLLRQEIIEKKRSERALQKSEQKYRNIFENAPSGIFQTSLEGKFLSMNPAMARMFGYASPQEMTDMVSDSTKTYLEPDQRKDILDAILQHGGWQHFKTKRFRKNGTIMHVCSTVRPVLDHDNAVRYIEGFMEDITEQEEQREAFQLEMSRAKEIYDLVMEPQFLLTEGVRIVARCLPADKVGGDVVEVLKADENTLLIFLADVTGHGVPAAMTANTLKMLFREITETITDPSLICRHLNKTMYKIILQDDIIAAFCGQVDLKSMTLNYYLSGLPCPIILRNSEKLHLKPTGLPLGFFGDLSIESRTFSLEKDDVLFAFTDGITEAKSENGKLFGSKGVESSIGEGKDAPPVIVDRIIKEASRFQQKDTFRDDVIVLAVNF